MQCPRCQGQMMLDTFFDYCDDTGRFNFKAWRCLNCGAIDDPIIQVNRKQPSPPRVSRKRKLVVVVNKI